jgi:hypothetical protein
MLLMMLKADADKPGELPAARRDVCDGSISVSICLRGFQTVAGANVLFWHSEFGHFGNFGLAVHEREIDAGQPSLPGLLVAAGIRLE